MNLIYLGKVVNTHGIKGEIRLISDFKFKDSAFKLGNKIKIGDDWLIINSYRHHKNFDMITLDGINDINDALKYKGLSVYINKEELDYEGFLDDDLIGLKVYDLDDNYRGEVVDIYKTTYNALLVIQNRKKYMVPYIEEFVKKIDIDRGQIIINYIKGLEDED